MGFAADEQSNGWTGRTRQEWHTDSAILTIVSRPLYLVSHMRMRQCSVIVILTLLEVAAGGIASAAEQRAQEAHRRLGLWEDL